MIFSLDFSGGRNVSLLFCC